MIILNSVLWFHNTVNVCLKCSSELYHTWKLPCWCCPVNGWYLLLCAEDSLTKKSVSPSVTEEDITALYVIFSLQFLPARNHGNCELRRVEDLKCCTDSSIHRLRRQSEEGSPSEKKEERGWYEKKKQKQRALVYVSVCLSISFSVCVCVREREGEGEKEGERERELFLSIWR